MSMEKACIFENDLIRLTRQKEKKDEKEERKMKKESSARFSLTKKGGKC